MSINKIIKEDGAIILETVNRSRSRGYRTEEEYQKELEYLKHKMIMEGRINKINKLNERINRT